jgi:PAS domain S-box-containing protein
MMSLTHPVSDPSASSRNDALSLDLLLSNLPGAAYRCRNDSEWSMVFVSDGIEKVTGYSAAAFTGQPGLSFASIILPEDRDQMHAAVAIALAQHQPFQVTYRIRTADGRIRWIWEQGALNRQAGMLEGFLADFTRVKHADLVMLEQASFLQQARDAIIAMDMTSRISYWNQGAERLYGWRAQEATGKRFGELLCDEQAHYETAFAHTLADGEWSGELAHVRRDGSKVDTDTRWTLLAPDAVPGACQKILVIATDISERKSSEAKIFRLAFFDHLTDLPNRANLLDQLRRALVGSARSGKCGATTNSSPPRRAASKAACVKPTWWRAWAVTSSWC